MADTQESIREKLFTDAYWDAPVFDPTKGLSPKQRGQYYADCVGVLKDRAKAHEIGDIVLSLAGGGTLRTIPEGEAVPMPLENPRQVVKIVEETREIIPRFRRKPVYHKGQKALIKTIHNHPDIDFDILSELMDTQHVYTLPMAIDLVKRPKEIAVVKREVGYVRAAERGALGAVLCSGFFDEHEIAENARVCPMPQMLVGGIYKKDERTLVKISSAALIEANGVRWTHDKGGGTRKEKKQRSKAWLPAFRGV